MRALLSFEPGPPETLRLVETPDPVPGPGDVLIAVKAAALNYPDLLLIQDRYQVKAPRPFAPGSEVAGIIEAVGPGGEGVKIGDRVIGLGAWGGLAEKMVAPLSSVLLIGDELPFANAAALIVTYATSHYALKDPGTLKAGDALVVLGAAGGVGLAAIQLAKTWGAAVVAAVSSEEKAAVCRAEGADVAIVYARDLADRASQRAFSEALRAACPSGSADIVFDPVGGAYSEAAFRTLGWGGRHLVIGFTAGVPALPTNLPLLKGASLVGVNYGEFAMRDPSRRQEYLRQVVALHAAGRIRPHISTRLPFERAAEGLIALGNRSSVGKIVIDF